MRVACCQLDIAWEDKPASNLIPPLVVIATGPWTPVTAGR